MFFYKGAEAAWLSRDNRAQGLELKIQIQYGVGFVLLSCYTLRWSPLTEDTREQHSVRDPQVTPLTHRHKQPRLFPAWETELLEQGITLIWKLADWEDGIWAPQKTTFLQS